MTLLDPIALIFFALSGIGLLLVIAQSFALRAHLRQRAPAAKEDRPAISVLKPLCGVDDDLLANLEVFAHLNYPRYEVLLGVRDITDPAYPVARWAEQLWPTVMRVVVQRGEPGLNPKVNQLITLAELARYDVLVVNDSNIRVAPNYLSEIAGYFEDENVGLVTHPLAGAGEQRLGALLDNLYLSTYIGPGVIAAKRLLKQDFVVSKSMALRRIDLRALGGFEAVKDVLAEDYLTGRLVVNQLKKAVAVARTPVINIVRYRRVSEFVARYARWGVLQRQIVGLPVYLVELLLNPIFFASLGLALVRNQLGLDLFLGCCLTRGICDCLAVKMLRGGPFAWSLIPFTVLKDLLAVVAWAYGLVHTTVNWRGNRLLVLRDSRLEPLAPAWPSLAGKASRS